MIKKLKKRLTLLFICSVMSIFTVVFCLFIHESIQSKKENEMYFFFGLDRKSTRLNSSHL